MKRELTPEAQAEIDAFKAHLERHKEGSAPDCRFCAEREATQTEAAIRGLTALMDGARDAAVRGTAACALGVIARLKAAVSVPPEAARRSKAEDLLLGLHKIVADLAPHFDKPLTEESMPRWIALDSAQKAVAQYFAASPEDTAPRPREEGTNGN